MQAVLFRDLGSLAWASSREHLATRPWGVRVGLQAPLTVLQWCALGTLRGFEHDGRRMLVHLMPLRPPQRDITPRPPARPPALAVLVVAWIGCVVLSVWLLAWGLSGVVTAGFVLASLWLAGPAVLSASEGALAPPASDWQLGLLVLEDVDRPIDAVLDVVRARVPWGDTVRLLPTNDEEWELCRRLGAEPSSARRRWMIAVAPVPGGQSVHAIVPGEAVPPAPTGPRGRGDVGHAHGGGTVGTGGLRPRWVGSSIVWSSGTDPVTPDAAPEDGDR